MNIIGFATEFYTLWSYEVIDQYSSNDTVNGVPGGGLKTCWIHGNYTEL